MLGELMVTGSSPDSLSLSWTVPQGHFDSFTIQYKDRDGRPQVVRVGGEESEVAVRGLEPGRKYKMHLYGLHGGRRVGPVSAVGLTGEWGLDRQGGEDGPWKTFPLPRLRGNGFFCTHLAGALAERTFLQPGRATSQVPVPDRPSGCRMPVLLV